MIASKDIPDIQLNVYNDSESLEHSQKLPETLEVFETEMLTHIVKEEPMVTLQNSKNREYSRESLTGVVGVAQEQLLVENKQN